MHQYSKVRLFLVLLLDFTSFIKKTVLQLHKENWKAFFLPMWTRTISISGPLDSGEKNYSWNNVGLEHFLRSSSLTFLIYFDFQIYYHGDNPKVHLGLPFSFLILCFCSIPFHLDSTSSLVYCFGFPFQRTSSYVISDYFSLFNTLISMLLLFLFLSLGLSHCFLFNILK